MLPHTRALRRPLPETEQVPDAAHDPLWWARIRLTGADLALITRALSHPATKPQLTTLWQAFLLEQAETRAALEQTDWSQVPDDDLVAYGGGRAAVLACIGSFLPSEYDDVPFAVRRSLYVHLLVLFGIGAVAAGAPVSPHFLALEAVRLHQGGQYAVREMSRRGSKHVGMHMALLLLAARGAHKAVVAQALEALRKAMDKKIPPETRDVIGRASHTGGTTDFHAAVRAAIDAQSFETGQQRWGYRDWRTLLTQGFAGGLDIAPRAVADDLKDLARALRRLPIPASSDENVLRDEEDQAETRLMEEKLNDAAEDLARHEAEVFADRLLMDQLKAAADLAPREVEVFDIVRALGYEHGAIKTAAERLGIKEGAARVAWFRALKKLTVAAQRLEAPD